jgi:hypothetical protein
MPIYEQRRFLGIPIGKKQELQLGTPWRKELNPIEVHRYRVTTQDSVATLSKKGHRADGLEKYSSQILEKEAINKSKLKKGKNRVIWKAK